MFDEYALKLQFEANSHFFLLADWRGTEKNLFPGVLTDVFVQPITMQVLYELILNYANYKLALILSTNSNWTPGRLVLLLPLFRAQ